MMAILVLHKYTGTISIEQGRIDEYARRSRLDMVPAILDGDVCVTLLWREQWIATAQLID
jgi:hypothetical protein